jgi:hypothetical protein
MSKLKLKIKSKLKSKSRPRLRPRLRPQQIKQKFKLFINVNYILGFLYAFYFFLTTSRQEEMATRRLWAYECWLILTGYGVFIYLFYLEKSALANQRGLFRFMQIQAVQLIEAPKQDLLDWFEQIARQPEQYSFDAHAGIRVEQGGLMQPGSIFTTREKFFGITLELRFKVVAADPESGFEFALESGLPAWLEMRGKFEYQLIDQDLIRLELRIFNHPQQVLKRIVSGLFYLSPFRIAVARQLRREVQFIEQELNGGVG